MLVLVLAGASVLWASQPRVALVVGNARYGSGALANPENDARDMGQALEAIGFDVILGLDVDRKGLLEIVREFGRRLSRVQGGIGLFYYAGHGVQINGVNYLVPVNIDARNALDAEYESVKAARVLGTMEAGGTDLNVVVLDACRDNPFVPRSRSLSQGLGGMAAPEGTLMAYATKAGFAAEDGSNQRNSPYTEALLRHIRTPGLEIREMFNRVGLDVKAGTGNAQIPWISNDPFPPYYLAGSSGGPVDPRSAPGKGAALAPFSSHSKRMWTEPFTGMEMVWVDGGCFDMGSTAGGEDERPVHRVCLDGFWMGKTEVTQGQWNRIMGSSPARFRQGDAYPVVRVNWHDVQTYVQELNRISGQSFVLPSEAQWEYAARSRGQAQTFSGGEEVDRLAWYDGNAGGYIHPVATKAPNGLGLHDMSGNVWEWCADVYDSQAYSLHGGKNPLHISPWNSRVIRGGGWDCDPPWVTATVRDGFKPVYQGNYLGFRLCLPRLNGM
ncbi:MAG: SUMF1/EgtB/PvdO family nonheme iron enzyme [Desulfobacterales bacterium]|nr:SUMF1/EgtB/PvdO family nonheme iron enzyme [Desulfobacterales bacterium]